MRWCGWMYFPTYFRKRTRTLSLSHFRWGMSQTTDLTFCGVFWNWWFRVLNPLIQFKFHPGIVIRTFFPSAGNISFIFDYSRNITCSLALVRRPTSSSASFNCPNMPMWSLLFSLTSMSISVKRTKDNCRRICASMALLRQSIPTLQLVCRMLPMVFLGCAVRLVTPVVLTFRHLPIFSTVWTSHCVQSKATRPTSIGWNTVGIRTVSRHVVGPTMPNWPVMDLVRHFQGTPRRLLFWAPATPPSHLHPSRW